MNRRDLLKRIGGASIGITTLAAGNADAALEPRRVEVEIDGETYLVSEALVEEVGGESDLRSIDEIDPEIPCNCDFCDWRCDVCGPCPQTSDA